eukprot:m.172609 g.172609  ORF g.172609 m.172609 type:complete len:804 (+) comp25218_c0_seq6:54-2465(+)
MADLQSKYQKLAQEYTKLKTKNGVLKKAVLESQEKESQLVAELSAQKEELNILKTQSAAPKPSPQADKQVAALMQTLKAKDQELRMATQKVDKLTFKSQQLTEQLETAKADLDIARLSKSSSKSKQREAVTRQEEYLREKEAALLKRGKEVERLQTQLQNQREQHARTVKGLQGQVKQLQNKDLASAKEIKQLQVELGKIQSQTKESIQTHTELVGNRDKELAETRQQLLNTQEQLAKTTRDFQELQDQVTIQETSKPPFLDTCVPQFNELNIPIAQRGGESKGSALRVEGQNFIKDFTSLLSTLYSYLEQRVKARDGGTLSEVNSAYCSVLRGHPSYVKPLERTFALFIDQVDNLEAFTGACGTLSAYMQRLLPHHELSLTEENNQPSCSMTLQSTNSSIIKSWQGVSSCVISTVNNLKLLTSPSNDGSSSAAKTHLLAVSKNVTDLHAQFRALCSQFSSKVALEQRLSLISNDVATIHQCLTSTLSKLVASLEIISKTLESKISLLMAGGGLVTRGVPQPVLGMKAASPAVQVLNARARKYLRSLDRPAPPSVAYADALRNNTSSTSNSSTESNLAQQLSQARDKVSELEKEREHFMLEYQLANIKLKKLQERVASGDLGRSLSSSSNISTTTSSPASQPDQTPARLSSTRTNEDDEDSEALIVDVKGVYVTGTALPQSVEAGSREELIKNHFTQRIGQLSAQLQFADSKAVAYYEEARALALQLERLQASQRQHGQTTKLAQQQIKELQETLETTKRNYEEQLAVMTEHVMRMNDQLTERQEVIDSYKRNTGKSKSGKRR